MSDPIIIIGATGGIGSALAERLAADDRALHLIARDAERLGTLALRLGATHAAADVLDEQALAAAIAAAGPRVAGLVYAVGSIDLAPLAQLDAARLLATFHLNAAGAVLAVRAARQALLAGEGSVVLFSSIAAAQGFQNHVSIAAAKGAVEAATRALAVDLAPAVRVNAIAPSLTRTPLAARFTGSAAMAQAIATLHPLPRIGEAAEIAALAAFLLGPDAGWITGQVLHVDGGRSTLRSKG